MFYRMKMGSDILKKVNFDIDLFVEIHRQTAIALFGDRLDEDRNVIGTDYYFDNLWIFHKRN